MSDFGSMSRESKKDKLRRQIVSPQQPAWNAEPEEDSEAVVRRAHNRVLRHRWILVLLVLLLIAAGAAAWFFYQRNYRYSGYETAWQVDLNECFKIHEGRCFLPGQPGTHSLDREL